VILVIQVHRDQQDHKEFKEKLVIPALKGLKTIRGIQVRQDKVWSLVISL
jgi:hypothetical protein